ncbi:hypothetical protein Cni_G22654 [Canna indica]|uniref:Uncharacterized protein n=1 Tax=Canna indica TaxID=4628 RepID=A0AAQ3QJS0_9LILI|nr:hypothetical protein Cni_G22654 [Canna indica]
MASTMAAPSSDPLGILQILWRALQLPAMAGGLILPLLLLTLLASSLLFLSAYNISPVVLDLVAKLYPLFKNPRSPEPPNVITEIGKDLRDIARLTSLVASLFFFASLLLMVATVYTFAMAYSARSLSPRQLLLRVARRWYQTLVTRLYVVLLTLGLALLSLIVVGAVMLASDEPNAADGCGVGLSAAAVLLYLYLSTRWAMSLVITTVEETWGIGALSWSVELFIGNKKRGTLLTLILKAVQLAIYVTFAAAMVAPGTATPSPDPPAPPAPEEQMKLWLIVAAATALWEMYSMAVYTVFYYECRKSHGLDWGHTNYTVLPDAAAVKV